MKILALLYTLCLFCIGLKLEQIQAVPEIYFQKNVKITALHVLENKCNVCHLKKKRTDVFSLNNMDSLAQNIYEQVFITQKMPKGRKIELTHKELQELKDWLSTCLKKE